MYISGERGEDWLTEILINMTPEEHELWCLDIPDKCRHCDYRGLGWYCVANEYLYLRPDLCNQNKFGYKED